MFNSPRSSVSAGRWLETRSGTSQGHSSTVYNVIKNYCYWLSESSVILSIRGSIGGGEGGCFPVSIHESMWKIMIPNKDLPRQTEANLAAAPRRVPLAFAMVTRKALSSFTALTLILTHTPFPFHSPYSTRLVAALCILIPRCLPHVIPL